MVNGAFLAGIDLDPWREPSEKTCKKITSWKFVEILIVDIFEVIHGSGERAEKAEKVNENEPAQLE